MYVSFLCLEHEQNLIATNQSMFDRLKVRHLHDQMVQAYDDAKAARYDIEEDLEKWAEAKARRAQLRQQYNTLRGRAGRQAALIS
jgi:ribosomal protein S13